MVTMGYSNCKGLLVLNRIPGLWMDSNTRMALQRKPVPKRGIWSKPGNAFGQIWKIYMGEIGWAGWLCFKRGWIEDVMASSASLDLRTPTAGKWKKIWKYLSHLYSQPSKIWAGLSFCTPIFDAKHNLRKLHTQTEVIQLTNVLYICTHYPPTQNASHHQDDITFLAYTPLFATVTRCMIDPMYTSHISNPKKNLGLFFVHQKKRDTVKGFNCFRNL